MQQQEQPKSLRILPKDLEEYIRESISDLHQKGGSLNICVLSDYGYYDNNGFIDVNGPDDGDYIDYRVFKISSIKINIIGEGKKNNIKISMKLHTIEPEDEGNYTIFSTYPDEVLQDLSVEEAQKNAVRILNPYYKDFRSKDPIPIRSVLADMDTMRNIISKKYDFSQKEANILIREFIELLIGNAQSDMELFTDDGETSKWETLTDKLNRMELVYTLIYGDTPDEVVSGSVTALINAIRQKY